MEGSLKLQFMLIFNFRAIDNAGSFMISAKFWSPLQWLINSSAMSGWFLRWKWLQEKKLKFDVNRFLPLFLECQYSQSIYSCRRINWLLFADKRSPTFVETVWWRLFGLLRHTCICLVLVKRCQRLQVKPILRNIEGVHLAFIYV